MWVVEYLDYGFVSPFFLCQKQPIMRKIIITVIATFFLIAPFEKAKGQWQEQTVITSADFPTVNVLTGVNARLSFGFWWFELFGEIGQCFQVFEEQMTTETWGWSSWIGNWQLSNRTEYYSPRFQSMPSVNFGMKFRVTDRDCIILGYSGNFLLSWHRVFNWSHHFYLGYIRRENLSQRTSIEFSVLYTPSRSLWSWLEGDSWGFGGLGSRTSFLLGAMDVGVRLNYEVVRNLKLNVQLGYVGRFNVRQSTSWEIYAENVSGERLLTRNFLNLSVGVHYHFQIFGGQQQQAPQRQPRQRVAPHHRALPCPPGQMRHGRSWDRPSSVFNHPSGR